MKLQFFYPGLFVLMLMFALPIFADEMIVYPANDREITYEYDNSNIIVEADGQWWPHLQWVPSPPLENQFVCEFDLSGIDGASIAYAELHFYVEDAVAMDAIRLETRLFEGNGIIDTGDYDAGTAYVGTWQWDSPSPGTRENLIQQHAQFDVTRQIRQHRGSYLGVNIRLAGDRSDYEGNQFNDTDTAHWITLAAVENIPEVRPYLKIIPLPPQDTNSWQMKQKDFYNTGRAAVAVAADRLNDTFFDTIIWQKQSGGGTGAFYGTGMIYYDGVGPDGTDVTLCSNTWPNHVTCVDRHTGKLIWQDTTTGGDAIGKSTQAFSNDGTTVYATQDAMAAGHRCIAFPTLDGPGTNGVNVRGNGADTDPTHLQYMSPTIGSDGRIFLHKWNEKVYAGVDNGAAIQEVWAASVTNNVGNGDTALYEDEGTLKVIQTGRGARISAFDGNSGDELWQVMTYAGTDASPTIDPQTGSIYVPAGFNEELYIVGLDINGGNLWESTKILLNDSNGESNDLEEARSTGCLSHDGRTFYFQSAGPNAAGKLYAINTADGSVKWTYETHSWRQYDNPCASPVVTENGVIIVGNNYGGQYFAIMDNGSEGILLDTFDVQAEWNGPATMALASASLSPDGLLYLPLRTAWTAGNGDGEVPDGNIGYYLTAFDLVGCDGTLDGDLNGDCKVNLTDLAILSENWLVCKTLPAMRCQD